MDNFQQTLKFKINVPMFRIEIKGSFEELANLKKQKNEWLKDAAKYAHGYWDSLMFYALENLYNDCELHEYKKENVGKYFYNEKEAKQVYEFCKWFNELTENIGENQPDSAYLNHPEWYKVYSSAKKLFELMDENDKKYNFNEEYAAYRKAEDAKYLK